MAGLLSGLSSMGLGNLEGMELFSEPKKEEESVVSPKEQAKITEAELIYDKSTECPLCDYRFTTKTVKAGKTPLVDTDMDLRPKYEGIDIIKYDVIECPRCGFSALTRFFKPVTSVQAKEIRQNISTQFKYKPLSSDIITYEEAIERYKLALVNAIVKHAKPSEKAYICLKAGWVLRGAVENLDKEDADYEQKKTTYEAQEDEFLKNAMEGFIAARQSEGYPMCGMDEVTVEYLISVLAIRFHRLEIASKLVANILVSPNANNRMKDKARDLKEMILQELKEKGAK